MSENNINKRLMREVDRRNLAGVLEAIESGADVNYLKGSDNSREISPLMQAAYDGSLGIVKALIEHGADVNLRNNKNETALHEAISGDNNLLTVKTLIEYGAKVNAIANSTTPLIKAADSYRQLDKVMLLLSVPGINIDEKNELGETALGVAISKRDGEVVNILSKAGRGEFPNSEEFGLRLADSKEKTFAERIKKPGDSLKL